MVGMVISWSCTDLAWLCVGNSSCNCYDRYWAMI
jgi:hypothetical protein